MTRASLIQSKSEICLQRQSCFINHIGISPILPWPLPRLELPPHPPLPPTLPPLADPEKAPPLVELPLLGRLPAPLLFFFPLFENPDLLSLAFLAPPEPLLLPPYPPREWLLLEPPLYDRLADLGCDIACFDESEGGGKWDTKRQLAEWLRRL
jgi:hypothetical protein